MADNFLAGDRDQAFLLPPDPTRLVLANHLAWFVLEVVDQVDLYPFLAADRLTGTAESPTRPGCCWDRTDHRQFSGQPHDSRRRHRDRLGTVKRQRLA